MGYKKLFKCCACGSLSVHDHISRTERRVYSSYNCMKSRCLNKNIPQYKDYGGRGIKICDRWLESFDNFYIDMGEPPTEKHSIDRIDNNGDYTLENCRWATREEQQNNTQQNSYLTYKGKTLTTTQWSKETGIPVSCIWVRIKLGWKINKILTTPSIKGRNQFGVDGIPVTFNKKTMSLKKWSIETGIPYSTLMKRINKYGYSIKRALTDPVKEKKISLKNYLNLTEKSYKNLQLKIKESGIHSGTIYKRVVKYGWSIKKSLKEPVKKTINYIDK